MHQNALHFRIHDMSIDKLRDKIIFSINNEEIRRAKMYFLVFTTTALVSIFGLVASVRYMIREFYQSGFYTYFSLVFSDTNTIVVYWRELSLSLVETMPMVGITISLIAVCVFLISLRMLVKNTKGVFLLAFDN